MENRQPDHSHLPKHAPQNDTPQHPTQPNPISSVGSTLEPSVSSTAKITPDAIGLGKTPGQRGAEVIAGIRAEMTETPEAVALTRMSGRIFARMLINMGRNREMMRFIPARMLSITEIVRRSIPMNKANLLFVEIAGGYSPRTLHIARMLPHARIVEIDLPDVVEEKQRRLKSGHIDIPTNLSWRTADLGVTNLADVLEGEKADIVCAEGLNLYFRPEEIVRMNGFVRQALVEGGIFITEVYYRQRFVEARQNPQLNNMVSFFLRQAGQIPGLADSEADIERWFTDAGFTHVEMRSISEVMREINEPVPVIDLSPIVIAHNGEAKV
jgi:O-methyltransferase involved in polyketide biosynthesis